MGKFYIGTIVCLKNSPRTISVSIEYMRNHPRYHKTYHLRKKKQVHVKSDEEFNIGDKVKIISCKPYSSTKKFLFVKKVF